MSDTVDLKKIQNILRLEDVYFKEVTAKVYDDFDQKYTAAKYGVQLKFSPNGHVHTLNLLGESDGQQMKIVRFFIDAGVRLVGEPASESSERKVRAEITATAIADYRFINSDNVLSQDESAAFSQNVAWHVWPYWRELVHSATGRLRLPPVVLPMHRYKSSLPMTTEDQPTVSDSEVEET